MTAIGGRSSPEKSSSPNGIWLIRELSLDRAVGQPAPRPQRTLVGAAPAHSCRPVRPVFGLCCRWLDGVIRQQCVGHLPFERRATANGGFSVLPTGTTDPQQPFGLFAPMTGVQRLLPLPTAVATVGTVERDVFA